MGGEERGVSGGLGFLGVLIFSLSVKTLLSPREEAGSNLGRVGMALGFYDTFWCLFLVLENPFSVE